MRSGFPADPLLAALVDLLLPERHELLKRVDRFVAGGECVVPKGGRDAERVRRISGSELEVGLGRPHARSV